MTLFVIIAVLEIGCCSLTLLAWTNIGPFALAGPIVGIGLTALFWWMAFGTEKTVTFKVEGKERITEDKDGKWMVYAVGGDTYEDTDAWFHGKTHSTDLYRDVKVGHMLVCKVNGFRFGLLSSYPNLLKCSDTTDGSDLRY